MKEVDSTGDAKDGATTPEEPSSPARTSEPPPSSQRGFIGTNTNAVQAYIPPTALPETAEQAVPGTKVALAEEVDPRKAPTQPNLKKAAQAIASEHPPPLSESPTDSQVSGIRRGAGYAPSRSQFPPPMGSSARIEGARRSTPPAPPSKGARRSTPPEPPSKGSLRSTPANPLTKGSLRSTPANPLTKASLRPLPGEAPETPEQRRTAVLLILLFAALLAVAIFFFLRRAP